MTKNILIVEGLPGVGKSYFCEILQREIRKISRCKKPHFFEERDFDHPFHIAPADVANDIWSIDYRDCISLVENKCANFFTDIYRSEETYIFDCGLLQRPLFYSLIMSDFAEEEIFSHLHTMYGNYEKLPCQQFYLESRDHMSDFESIYRSRGSGYRDSIESVWNNSRYGMERGLKGLEGALEVLEYFKELKERFLYKLDLSPVIVDNTAKEPEKIRNKIVEILRQYSQ
jgi:hypothetical protein